MTAIAVVMFHDDPLGNGVDAYDFTTAENSLTSHLDVEMNQDIRALLELRTIERRKTGVEKQRTLVVHREVEYGGKKALFISYTEEGIPKNSVSWLEKDAESCLWLPTYVFDSAIDDADLKKSIADWKQAATGK